MRDTPHFILHIENLGGISEYLVLNLLLMISLGRFAGAFLLRRLTVSFALARNMPSDTGCCVIRAPAREAAAGLF